MADERIRFAALKDCTYFHARDQEGKIRSMLHGVADGTVEPEAAMREIRLSAEHGTAAHQQVIYATARELIERHAESGTVDPRLRDALVRMSLETARICDKANPAGQIDEARRRGSDLWVTYRNASARASALAAAHRKDAEDLRTAASDADLLRVIAQLRTRRIPQ